jgi:hypothetical protein
LACEDPFQLFLDLSERQAAVDVLDLCQKVDLLAVQFQFNLRIVRDQLNLDIRSPSGILGCEVIVIQDRSVKWRFCQILIVGFASRSG